MAEQNRAELVFITDWPVEHDNKVEIDDTLYFDPNVRSFLLRRTHFYKTGYGSDPAPHDSNCDWNRVQTLLRDSPDALRNARELQRSLDDSRETSASSD